MMFEDLIHISNIDRYKVTFCAGTRFTSDAENIYAAPVVIIVKNEAGRRLFNEYLRRFNYREKNAAPLPEDAAFPQYILSMSYITMGCHFGLWEYFSSREELAREINIQAVREDFTTFASELQLALGQPGVRSAAEQVYSPEEISH